jgi:hypothetical protein
VSTNTADLPRRDVYVAPPCTDCSERESCAASGATCGAFRAYALGVAWNTDAPRVPERDGEERVIRTRREIVVQPLEAADRERAALLRAWPAVE